MPRKKRSKDYTYHLVRAIVALLGATLLSWAVWKLLDYYLLPNSPFVSAAIAALVAVVVLAVDHFHLKEIE